MRYIRAHSVVSVELDDTGTVASVVVSEPDGTLITLSGPSVLFIMAERAYITAACGAGFSCVQSRVGHLGDYSGTVELKDIRDVVDGDGLGVVFGTGGAFGEEILVYVTSFWLGRITEEIESLQQSYWLGFLNES